MRALLFTLLWMSTAATAATVYKWVDDDGVTHFSDQPHENAQKLELKAPQTYSAGKTASSPARRAPSAPPASKQAQSVYTSCSITEPTNDQMFMNTSTVTAGVVAQPP